MKKLTVKDLRLAYTGDRDARVKLVKYVEDWRDTTKSIPYRFIDMFNLTESEVEQILDFIPGYKGLVEACDKYEVAINAGIIKCSKYGRPLTSSINKWLNNTTLSMRPLLSTYCSCPCFFFEGAKIWLGRTTAVIAKFDKEDIVSSALNDTFREANKYVKEQDKLFTLNREAMELYDKLDSETVRVLFKDLGWASEGYRHCSSLVIYSADDDDNSHRLLTKEELEKVISICKEYKEKHRLLVEQLVVKSDFKF